MIKTLVDTNVIMNHGIELFNTYTQNNQIYLCDVVIQELDKHKCSSDTNKQFQARQAHRLIKANKNKITFCLNNKGFKLPDSFDPESNDNKIINIFRDLYSKDSNFLMLSNDLNIHFKCECLGLPCEEFGEDDKDLDVYKGYKEVILNNEELAHFYNKQSNDWDLIDNQYLIIKNSKNEVVDKQKWTIDNRFKSISYKTIDSTYAGKIKPRNIQQELAFDLIQNKNITIKCLYGCFGSGKDAIMSAHALNFIQKGMYDKIIFVRNNVDVKNTKPVGYLKGELDSKLLPYAMPLADHVGGVDGLNLLISQNKIELQHMGFMRGRDIKNSIIYCSEAENLTKEHIQLLISRLAEGSTLWLNGDFKQIDDVIFERNNGLMTMINSLKGNRLFGCVEFNITERSESAQLAELLD